MTWFGWIVVGWLIFVTLNAVMRSGNEPIRSRNPNVVTTCVVILNSALVVGILVIGTGRV